MSTANANVAKGLMALAAALGIAVGAFSRELWTHEAKAETQDSTLDQILIDLGELKANVRTIQCQLHIQGVCPER